MTGVKRNGPGETPEPLSADRDTTIRYASDTAEQIADWAAGVNPADPGLVALGQRLGRILGGAR